MADVSNTPIPEELCGARKPEPPQQGERCAFLPHRGSPGHSWEPWSIPREGYVDRGVYDDEKIEIGDHVTIGGGRVHWLVRNIWQARPGYLIYRLQSGLSGRVRTEIVGSDTVKLHIHTKAAK